MKVGIGGARVAEAVERWVPSGSEKECIRRGWGVGAHGSGREKGGGGGRDAVGIGGTCGIAPSGEGIDTGPRKGDDECFNFGWWCLNSVEWSSAWTEGRW